MVLDDETRMNPNDGTGVMPYHPAPTEDKKIDKKIDGHHAPLPHQEIKSTQPDYLGMQGAHERAVRRPSRPWPPPGRDLK